MQKIIDIPKLQPRPADGHKGTFGKICIVGGSIGFSGAPVLAGRAALRSGAGLVRVAVPQSILAIAAGLEPCYTTIPLADDSDGRISAEAAAILIEQTKDNDVFAFGMGAGVCAGVQETLSQLLKVPSLRLVIDADGLNTLCRFSGKGGWIDQKKADVVLTPHPGEAKRLWDAVFRKPMPEDRIKQAMQLVQHTGCIVVLKGAGTVVSDGQKTYINTTGNPGMATAGCGDVLTGIIAALAGQGLSLFDASVLGVYVHGLAGDVAAKTKGQISLIATDIIEALPQAFALAGM